ncbi:hypothetical protein EI94DRAFT_1751203 [Lactarius quietus]|nr:hypothetical protein EI94DRAFT_1751203 [Lactarius quietus]
MRLSLLAHVLLYVQNGPCLNPIMSGSCTDHQTEELPRSCRLRATCVQRTHVSGELNRIVNTGWIHAINHPSVRLWRVSRRRGRTTQILADYGDTVPLDGRTTT